MDDIGAGIIVAVLLALSALGVAWASETFTAFTIPKNQWECVETAPIKGKAECIKYERKK